MKSFTLKDITVSSYEIDDMVYFKAFVPMVCVQRVEKHDLLVKSGAKEVAAERATRMLWCYLYGGMVDTFLKGMMELFKKTGPTMFVTDPVLHEMQDEMRKHLFFPGPDREKARGMTVCPHCGSMALLIREIPEGSYVFCNSCGGRGPQSKTIPGAWGLFCAARDEERQNEFWKTLEQMRNYVKR